MTGRSAGAGGMTGESELLGPLGRSQHGVRLGEARGTLVAAGLYALVARVSGPAPKGPMCLLQR